MKLALHHQVTGKNEAIVKQLNVLLQTTGLKEVRFSVAYARWDGIGLLSNSLEKFLKGGGLFESIYGAANGVTTPDALHYGLFLEKQYPDQTEAGFIEDEFANSIYHPKIYEFRYNDRVTALIGSANLTGGGLARNGELMVELTVPLGHLVEKQLNKFWVKSRKASTKVTVVEIARLSSLSSGRENQDEVGGAKAGKKRLKVKARLAPKPLFQKILDLPKAAANQKSTLLAGMGPVTERPTHLYLQIFQNETGGQKGKPGSAVQLPVATLGVFFGLNEGESKEILFRFKSEEVRSRVIHNSNHTHQVRLNPIFSVERPAIIHFKRAGVDRYDAHFIPPQAYADTLVEKCPEQQRKGARRWGMFA